ncbi:MAG: hypothetical protein LBE12_17720 [Planctomycetaceae bacterium]|jgi:hypothetical protein|nr:hypothetical protein [Planctomycetaceae bacterium]
MYNILFQQLIGLIFVFFCCCTFIPEKAGYADVMIPAKEDLVQKFQLASHVFTDSSDSFFISILTSKIETLVPNEENISYQIRTVLARHQQQWLARTEVLDSGLQSKKTKPYFELFLTQKGQVLQWTSDNMTCQIRPFSESNIYLYWDYTRYLGLNVYKSIAESNNISYKDLCLIAKSNPVLVMLNDPFIDETLVVNAEQYTVHPKPEKIDGFDCWIVEWSGMDKMWIDIEHGFFVRKRIVHFSPDSPIKQVVYNKDYQLIKEGLWLPYTQIVEEYANPEYKPQSLLGKPIRRIHYKVEKIDMDHTDVSIFNVTVPGGTYVIDSIRKMDFIVAEDDTDPFAEPIDLASSKLSSHKYRAIVIIVVDIVLLLLLWYFISKSKRKNKSSNKYSSAGNVFFLYVALFGIQGYASDVTPHNKSEWDFAPQWRERGDCAINSLFMLLKIEGKNVKLEDLKASVKIDPEHGSSFNTLKEIASQYGLDTKIRFVKPNDLSRLTGPYIVHGITSIEKNIGHCLVIIDYDKTHKNFVIIDPILGKYERKHENIVKQGFSGYILMPCLSTARFWDKIAGVSLIVTGLFTIGILLQYNLDKTFQMYPSYKTIRLIIQIIFKI